MLPIFFRAFIVSIVIFSSFPLYGSIEERDKMYKTLKTIKDGRSLIPRIIQEIKIKDLGAVGDGKTDDGPAFIKAMDRINKNGGNFKLILEPNKKYRIFSSKTVSPEGKLLAGAKIRNGGDSCVVLLGNVKNVIIDGKGSEFILTWPVHFIRVANSENVWLGNFSMTYDPFPCAQTRIIARHTDIKAIDVQLEPGFSLPNFDPPDATENHGKWGFSWGITPNCHFWTKFIKEIDASSTQKGIFRIFPQENRVKTIGGLKDGQRMLVPTLRNGARTSGTHSGFYGSSNVIMYNVISYAANQFSYHVTGNQGPVIFKKCAIRTRPIPGYDTEVVFSSWRDGFHTKQNMGPIVFDDCYFDGLYDDDINISQITLTIEKIIDKSTYRIRVLNGEGFPEIKPGYSIEAWNYRNGKDCGSVKITSIKDGDSPGAENGKKYWNKIITVDSPLQNIKGFESGRTLNPKKDAGIVLSVKEYRNWAIVKDSYFHGTVRFRSPGIYENNHFKQWMWVMQQPIVVECPLPQHQIFKNNIFEEARDINYGVPVSAGVNTADGDIIAHDITYIGNTIQRKLNFFNTRNITLSKNNFIIDGIKGSPVVINKCENVIVGTSYINGKKIKPAAMIKRMDIQNTADEEITIE